MKDEEILNLIKYDGLVKSLKTPSLVIPAQAGIQCFQVVRILWIPGLTGMTTFYDFINNEIKILHRAICHAKAQWGDAF